MQIELILKKHKTTILFVLTIIIFNVCYYSSSSYKVLWGYFQNRESHVISNSNQFELLQQILSKEKWIEDLRISENLYLFPLPVMTFINIVCVAILILILTKKHLLKTKIVGTIGFVSSILMLLIILGLSINEISESFRKIKELELQTTSRTGIPVPEWIEEEKRPSLEELFGDRSQMNVDREGNFDSLFNESLDSEKAPNNDLKALDEILNGKEKNEGQKKKYTFSAPAEKKYTVSMPPAEEKNKGEMPNLFEDQPKAKNQINLSLPDSSKLLTAEEIAAKKATSNFIYKVIGIILLAIFTSFYPVLLLIYFLRTDFQQKKIRTIKKEIEDAEFNILLNESKNNI